VNKEKKARQQGYNLQKQCQEQDESYQYAIDW
jgi:hypothetical protein